MIVQKTSCYNIVKSEKLKYDAIMSRLIEGGIGSVLGVFGIPLLQMKTESEKQSCNKGDWACL